MRYNRTMDETDLFQLTGFFKILSDPTRVKILLLLSHQEACVSELASQLGTTPSAVSHQLSVLKSNNLVKKRRHGKQIYYALSDNHVRAIIEKGRNCILSRCR